MKKICLLLTSLIYLAGCNQAENQQISENLASYNDHTISTDALNHYILSLPPQQRWPQENIKTWLTSTLKKLAIKQQLIAKAQQLQLTNQAQYQQKLHEIKRVLYSNQYIQSQSQSISINQEQLQQYYHDNNELFNLPEKRSVRHLYKRYNDNKQQAIDEITALRQRYLAGENFNLLASQYSDSETRHNDGFIGMVKQGDLSSDFDNIVFALKKDQPSELIFSKEGVHVFLVDSILVKKDFSFDAVKSLISQQVSMIESIKIIKQLAQDLPDTENLTVPDMATLPAIYQSGNNNPILKIGDYALSVGQFKQNLHEVEKDLSTIHVPDLAYLVLQDIAYRETIYQHMLKNNIALIDQSSLAHKSDETLLEWIAHYEIKAYLNQHPDLISAYYEQNTLRFATPVLLDLELLSIAISPDSNLMNALEQASSRLNQGEIDFKQLASNYPAQLTTLKKVNAAQLVQVHNKLLHFAFKLKGGEFSEPFTYNNHYHIVHITERTEAKGQPLIDVRDAVVQEYINNNKTSLYQILSEQLTADLNINQQGLEKYIQSHRQ